MSAVATDDRVLLSVRNLRAGFETDDGIVHPVDGVSFDVRRGEVFGIVGESGSGKSVTAMTILGLQPTLKIKEGEILWKGRDLLTMPEDERRKVRGGEIAMIFQDPLTALNPVHTIGKQIGEMARIHEGLSRKAAKERAIEMLELVGIPEPGGDMYPHEFSGGMRQRAMIAMAITCKPDLLIADEPTTALDVTVQAQVLDVLLGIKDEIDSAIIMITHDLGVVAGMTDRVMVMYAGRAVELGTTDEIFYETRHPYTLGLLASLPRLDDTGDEPLVIVGSPPSLIHRPSGCFFHPGAVSPGAGNCETDDPALRLVAGDDHLAACHYAEEPRASPSSRCAGRSASRSPAGRPRRAARAAVPDPEFSATPARPAPAAAWWGRRAARRPPTRHTMEGRTRDRRPPRRPRHEQRRRPLLQAEDGQGLPDQGRRFTGRSTTSPPSPGSACTSTGARPSGWWVRLRQVHDRPLLLNLMATSGTVR